LILGRLFVLFRQFRNEVDSSGSQGWIADAQKSAHEAQARVCPFHTRLQFCEEIT